MGLFKSPVRSSDASTLNGKGESQLNVAYASNSDKLDNMDSTEFGDVTGPDGAISGNIPILDETGKILSDSTYAPDDFATSDHIHSGYVATSSYTDTAVLNKVKNVDGYGSGLDADLWQGYNPNNFIAEDSQKLNSKDPSIYYNTLNVIEIRQGPPFPMSAGMVYMVALDPYDSWATRTPGEVVKYTGTEWISIGNIYDGDT